MLNVKKILENYEAKARTFSELVPYMILLKPDMTMNKDGSMTVCYEFSGVDQEGMEQIQVDRYALLVEQAFRNFDNRITVWWTIDRRRTDKFPGGQFSNAVSDMINAEWKKEFQSGQQYINTYHLSVTYSPPTGAGSFMDKVSYYSQEAGYTPVKSFVEAAKASLLKKSGFSYDAAQIEGQIKQFEDMLTSFIDTIGEVDLRRLSDESLLKFLHSRTSPANAGQPVKMPSYPAYLDSYLSSNTLTVEKESLRFRGLDGESHVTAISVKDWPDLSVPGLLDALMSIPGELTLSQVFRFAEHSKAEKYIRDVERHNRNLQKTLGAYIKEALTNTESRVNNEARLLMAEDAAEALLEMTAGGRQYGYYNMTLMAYGRSKRESEDTVKIASKILTRSGFMAIRESQHLLSAWAASMPAQWGELVRTFFMHSGNLADMAPIRTLQAGQERNKFLSDQAQKEMPALTVLSTSYSTPYYFNFHQGDLAHTIVLGPSGMGKSVFMNFLISQFRKYEPCNVFIFDKDYSCRMATKLQGGDHIDLLGERGGQVAMNPMLLLEDRDNWLWLSKWLEILITARGYEMRAEDDKSLYQALENVANQPRVHWKLQSLIPFLSKPLAEQLAQWVGDGQMARFFDNREDSFSLGEFSCIEMGGLFYNPRLASAFMEYAFFRLQQKLTGAPTIIYIEEAWFMLADPAFSGRINDWLKTLRKKNAFVVMATQSLEDIASSGIFSTIIDNIPNRIYLPNPNAYAHRDLYMKKFGLNETQVNDIRNAIPKSNYYIVTPLLSRMVYCRFPPKVLACLRSDTRAQNIFDELEKSGIDNWQFKYIEEMSS